MRNDSLSRNKVGGRPLQGHNLGPQMGHAVRGKPAHYLLFSMIKEGLTCIKKDAQLSTPWIDYNN